MVRYSNFTLGPDYDEIGGLDYVFAGIWTGFSFGIAGIVGICASYERKRSQYVETLLKHSKETQN